MADELNVSLSRDAVAERSFLSQVYLWMAMGLALTGIVAGWMALNPSLVVGLMKNFGLFLIIALAQIGLVIWLSSQAMNLSLTAGTAGFSIFATLNGGIFSSI